MCYLKKKCNTVKQNPISVASLLLLHVSIVVICTFKSAFTGGMSAQTMTTAVTANPHHFQAAPVSQSAYQNGVGGVSDGHVIMPKSHDPQDSQSQQQQEQPISNLANTKEKTPMCLINELARFNKVGQLKLSLCMRKHNNLGFQPGPAQTRLHSHRRRLEA